METFVVSTEILAFLFWVVAFWYAHEMYTRTFHVTTVWFFIRSGILFLGLASFANALEWAGIFPNIAESVQEIFVGIGSFAWLAAVHSYYRERRLLGHLEFIEEMEISSHEDKKPKKE